MKLKIQIVTIILYCITAHTTHCVLPSCTSPIDYTTTTVVELTNDIIIDSNCELVRAVAPFGTLGPNMVIFTATQPYKIIVTKNGIWNMQTFNTTNKIIQFAGSARLEVQQGGTLQFNGGQLIMTQNSTLVCP